MRRHWRALLALTVMCVASAAEAWVFYSKAGTGYVVDAATRRGVAGVIVETSWMITNFRDPSAVPLAELFHADTVTDSSGGFTFPAWGPVEADLHSATSPSCRTGQIARL